MADPERFWMIQRAWSRSGKGFAILDGERSSMKIAAGPAGGPLPVGRLWFDFELLDVDGVVIATGVSLVDGDTGPVDFYADRNAAGIRYLPLMCQNCHAHPAIVHSSGPAVKRTANRCLACHVGQPGFWARLGRAGRRLKPARRS